MNCTSYTLSGIGASCKDSIGGISKVFLAEYGAVAWSISANTAKPDVTNAFKLFNIRKGLGSMTSTLTVNDNAGSYFTTEVAMQFLKMETAKRTEVLAMLLGQCTGIVKDRNGKYWAIGRENPLEGSAGTGETGTAVSDANQYSVTISVDESELPYEITDSTTIAALEAIEVA